MLRKGVAWRDVPAPVVGCSGVTAWRRLRDWTEAGVWPRPHATLVITRRGVAHGSGLGKTRWVAERTFAWLLARALVTERAARKPSAAPSARALVLANGGGETWLAW